ncbi:unnamed protein product [Cunninghamella blakesleeana]
MNDLIPYSIRVIDYNQLSDEPPISAESSVSGSSNSCMDGSNDINNNQYDADNNRSMSIKNLLGINTSNDIPAPSSSASETPSMHGDTNKPLKIQLSSNKPNIPSSQQQEKESNDPQKESSWKRKPRSDPILLLAAAAKAIDRDEQLQNQQSQKRKYSGSDSLNHRSVRPRHPMNDQLLQNEKSKFSYQYLSMKQNPKIKRNAMHAYITYMIYTDLASSDKSYYSQNEKPIHSNGSISLPPAAPPSSSSSSSQLPTPTSQQELNPLPPYFHSHPPPLTSSSHSHPHQQNNNLDHHESSYSRGKGYPTPATQTSPDNTNWHYGLPNNTPSPSPSLQHRRDIKVDNNNNNNNNSSIMMARPLTAFLRDDLYT